MIVRKLNSTPIPGSISAIAPEHTGNSQPYKEKYEKLLEGDKGTLESLRNVLPMIEYNRVAYEYLQKIIKDLEKDLK